MEWTFYTVGDLRLLQRYPNDRNSQPKLFQKYSDAIEQYKQLPPSSVKVFGIVHGHHVCDLVRCLPLFPDDVSGENVLMADILRYPAWQCQPELILIANHLARDLPIHYYLQSSCIFPAPKPGQFPDLLFGATLCGSRYRQALKSVYVAGIGWCSAEIMPRAVTSVTVKHFPLIVSCRVTVRMPNGMVCTVDVAPWVYERLKRPPYPVKRPPYPDIKLRKQRRKPS